MQEIGESLRQEFEARLYTESSDGNTAFFSSIKKYKLKSFEENNVKNIVKKDGKEVEVAYQRDILAILIKQSYTFKNGVDIDKMFMYPLAPVSIPLCTPDGKNRKTAKSKLYHGGKNGFKFSICDVTHKLISR